MKPVHYPVAKRVFSNEAAALLATVERIKTSFDDAVSLLLDASGKVVVTGLGKSGLVAHKISATLASTGSPAVFVNAAEGLHGDLGIVCAGDVVVMVSNSGQTEELYRWLPALDAIGVRRLGIFGRTRTRLANSCNVVLDASVESEACPLNVAPMTSSTVALVIGDALAAALMEARRFTKDQFALLHPGGELGKRLFLKVKDAVRRASEVAVVRPTDSLRFALEELDRKNLGLVVVIDDQSRLRGVVSEADFRRCLLKRVDLDQCVSSIMTPDPISVFADATLAEAIQAMEAGRKVYVAPVTDRSGVLIGVLRMHDIVSSA